MKAVLATVIGKVAVGFFQDESFKTIITAVNYRSDGFKPNARTNVSR